MALKERGETAARVYVATGDGAIEEGAFWESLVLAASHSLNVCFLVENNDHSLATRIAERRCAIDLGRVAAAVGVDYELLTGNDPVQYAASLTKAPAGGGPIVREAMVTTFCNHAGPTPGWAADPRAIDAAGGLELEASPRDPVHVARRAIEEEEYQATNRFLTSLAVVVNAPRAAEAGAIGDKKKKEEEEEKPACRLT